MVQPENLDLYKIPSFSIISTENINWIINKVFINKITDITFNKIVDITYIKVLFISNIIFSVRFSSHSFLLTSFFIYVILIKLITILVILYLFTH